jgi:hypothetical protein
MSETMTTTHALMILTARLLRLGLVLSLFYVFLVYVEYFVEEVLL